MSTAEAVASIELGSRVVYVANDGVERNAIAKDIAHVGYNAALKVRSAFLNLVYLDDTGELVKVSAAPLLGSEADDEHIIEAATEARRRDPRDVGASYEDQIAISSEHFDRLKANPRTIGWRPAENAQLRARTSTLTQHEGETAPVFETKAYADGSSATGIAPLPDLSPAEQDLADEKVKAAAEIDAANAGRDPIMPANPESFEDVAEAQAEAARQKPADNSSGDSAS